MKKLKLLLLFILFLSLEAFSQTKNEPVSKTAEEWSALAEQNYSIEYPGSWELNRPGQGGPNFLLFSQLGSAEDTFRENVNLLIQDLKGMDIDLDKYTAISEEQIKTMLEDGKIIESKKQNANGRDFQKIIYTGKYAPYDLKFEQYYWVEGEKAYVLTLTCEVSQYEAFKKTGERILDSFRLK